MFFSRVLPVLFAASGLIKALSVSTHVDDYFFKEFINSLEHNHLTHLADSYKKVANTEEGKQIVDLLKCGKELTILAPNDEAFDGENTLLDANHIKYDTLLGNPDKNFISSDSYHHRRDGSSHTHSKVKSGAHRSKNKVRTKRNNDQGRCNLDLDKLQVQIVDQFASDEKWKRWDQNRVILIDRPVGNAKVVGRFSFKHLIILIIDVILDLPVKISELLNKPLIEDAPNGFQKALEALQQTGLINTVDGRDGITAFVPVDSSFSDGDHESEYGLAEILKNHFTFENIVFTTDFLKVRKATAESGKELKFTFKNDINYVSCGETKAIILRGDVVSRNGVLHVIDRPLIC